jgi:hypothetical protein
MPYIAIPRDTGGGCYGGNSLPRSEAPPRPYSPENDHANAPPPPCCVPAVSILRCIGFYFECDDPIFEAELLVQSPGYASQWYAPTLQSSVQDQSYGAPVTHVNKVVCGYGVWSDAQQSTPFAPASEMASINLNPFECFRRPKAFFHVECCDSIQ